MARANPFGRGAYGIWTGDPATTKAVVSTCELLEFHLRHRVAEVMMRGSHHCKGLLCELAIYELCSPAE